MGSLVALAGGAAVAFAATNIDDLFVLALFLADPRWRVGQVVAGQYAGIGALALVSLLGAWTTVLIPQEWIRFLGILPLAIGLKQLLVREDCDNLPSALDSSDGSDPGQGLFSGRTLTVATVTFVNGGDNIGVYVPFFASLDRGELMIVGTVFVAMTALWCAVSHALVRHPLLGHPLRHYGRVIAPFVLIALGLAILFELSP